MLDTTTRTHIERIRAQTLDRFTVDKIPEWLCTHTRHRGWPFSFKNHEYQLQILADTSTEVNVRKCSQVGMTEATLRQALAIVAIQRHFTTIYTLPTATSAGDIMKTRVDPIISDSDYLSDLLSRSTDNASVKQLGDSYLYMKGAASGNAPISTPADMLVHDELDFSDLDIVEQYQSRLTHSEYKWKKKFSTPTQPGFGIDAEFDVSRRHYLMVRCNHCNHYFVPDYYKHVRVPAFYGDLKEVNRRNLHEIRWREAYVECPSCAKQPSLQPEFREWVCENPNENLIAVGYQVSPFDVPNVITPGYLIEASTKYNRISMFVNYNLGLPMADAESTLFEEELRALLVGGERPLNTNYVMGIDMGMTCHVVVAAVMPDGQLLLVKCETVHYTKIVDRRKELARQYWPRMTVVDSQPYMETVYRMQMEDPNLFAAVYVNRNTVETHTVVDKEEDQEDAQVELRQVSINRNKAFDALMDSLRQGMILKLKDSEDDNWVAQLQDMKRIQKFNPQTQELEYVWSKSKDGNDHYHQATLYAVTASKMIGVSHHTAQMLPLLSTFRHKGRR